MYIRTRSIRRQPSLFTDPVKVEVSASRALICLSKLKGHFAAQSTFEQRNPRQTSTLIDQDVDIYYHRPDGNRVFLLDTFEREFCATCC